MLTGDDDEPLDYGQNPPDRIIDEYFSHIDCVDEIPIEWISWLDGDSNYKPFSMQYLECRHNGNLFLEKCHCCGDTLIMCRKYGGQCISNKCKIERLRTNS